MLPKWKLILTNWINCYFSNRKTKDLPVNLESLLDIISHLRENLNLDESKSSILDAHTIQEFILEKYPDFKFENGTIEPNDLGDLYLVASLLLFFVCVNSKNVHMKSAMCSKLSPEDQEVILMFSKHLMKCSKITIVDVQAAITDACGQDTEAAQLTHLQVSVAETPPALRSLHSEVRRLQAALDAERFDRSYLQEELVRTNMKVEKLLKDKEQYKLEIVNLKSQISLCCNQERESQGDNVDCNNVSKLMRQLEQMEERLLSAQEQLVDVQEERETYKMKLSQLKSEHEKLLAFSHQESARAMGLAEELEVERRHTQSLRELVAELRQHNHLNKMDSSLVECDDPNASIISLQHNASACSELCANVIEVQLEEERAKIVALKQQIQMLQDQLYEITRKNDEEKGMLTQIISEKEITVMTLKHRVNEEIEEKNALQQNFDDEVAKFNNELVEQDKRVKETQESSRHIIEKKVQEIQSLQEEKSSLLQTLSDEINKSEDIIKQLKAEIDAEHNSKTMIRDEYDSNIMKLNEKILNRNNELVDLQNKILENGEIIETLQLELKKEKELREDFSNKYNNELVHLNSIREQLQRESEDKEQYKLQIVNLISRISQCCGVNGEFPGGDVQCNSIFKMTKKLEEIEERLLSAQGQLMVVQEERDACNTKLGQLQSEHEKLLAHSHRESARASELAEELEAARSKVCDNMAEVQLQEEKEKVMALEQQIQMLQNELSDITRRTEEEKESLTQIISKTENIIVTLKHRVNEEIEEKNNLKKNFDDEVAKLNNELVEQEQRLKGTQENSRQVIEKKMQEIQNLQEEKLSLLRSLSDEINKSEDIIKQLKDEVNVEKSYKIRLRDEYDSNIMKLNEKILNRNNELVELQNKILEKGEIIETLQIELKKEKELRDELSNKYNNEIIHLNSIKEQLERESEDKERYKLQILNLKTQISQCCGDAREFTGEDVQCNSILKLTRQLQQMEERLHSAQEQLVDVQEEKECYKAKLSQWQSEHEKLLAISHQEYSRASSLVEELKLERRQTQTLRELVAERRQHNHLNEMDSGLIESDDPDAGINYLQFNSSSCSEVCANVMEVQLAEERANIVVLKQQLQTLKGQLSDIQKNTEEKQESLTQIISENENTIMTLKHRVNEEIEDKLNLKKMFDDEVAKLNEELAELEQRLKGTQENSRQIIEKKMQEIQNLQEEKLSLLQTLSDERRKTEDIVKQLKDEIDAEKSLKIRLRDEYDNHKMKLNEKVLNRNNELVELQNKILEKGEIIETLQLELRKEKELREELSNKYNNELVHLNSIREQVEQNLQQKSEETNDLHKHLQQHIASIEQINNDNDELKAKILQLQGDCQMLRDSKEKLLAELKNRDVKAEHIYKETENLKNLLYEEKQKQQYVLEETGTTVNAPQNEHQVNPANEQTDPLAHNASVKPLYPMVVQTCMVAVANQGKSNCKSVAQGIDVRDVRQQVDASAEHTQSSFESSKTISDLEKILQDRNRTIRSLQSDITDLKSLVAESENRVLDMSNDLEVTKENCQQLSSQLKKIVHQKNEEIADLKKQLTKMSVTENRASQIIKVSAKYQAIILKRIAEIKSNTVLKELTNFGNTTNCDNDLRRGLNARSITMEDLENFLDTTDRHLKRFSEKQLALQKERDRLADVNKINESEIINMRKFLTEVSVSIKTFNSVKELYTHKLSRVVSMQRTVRRDILGLEGQITDATMCKLERGYAAVMQDLSECAMNLERWVERTIGRIISVEKIQQSFSSEERPSLATTTIQNAGVEVQLEELENSFCKLHEEIARAQKGEGAKDAQAVTVMEVRAEYEDKLNRMKAKMKQLYQEQIGIFKEKQREEIVSLEQELQSAREKLEESSRAYEEHIRSLTTELWNVGEKFLMKKDEAEWLRRKQHSGSLMSLQHVHSSGLVPTQEEPSRPSDTHSLRSLPVTSNTNNKNEGRTLHMSDEEGEVFDNRCLRELATPPARVGRPSNRRATRDVPPAQDAPPAHRLSELQWRNSLCPPHLKSSYPAETQFASAIHEEDIKCVSGPTMSVGGRSQRKEVGITAYKKPGPPTPSKQAGRLSATDSELRESLRVETEPNASRKTSTPSRIRALFRYAKGDNEGTPRSRRLSNIFRKK